MGANIVVMSGVFQVINISVHEPDDSVRLTKREVELVARYLYAIHDHTAVVPAVGLYWVRTLEPEPKAVLNVFAG